MHHGRVIWGLLILVGLALPIANATASDVAGDMRSLAPKLLPSVVSIETKTMQTETPAAAPSMATVSATNLRISHGTGFIIDPAGYIVTNRHVIDNAYDIVVSLSDGTRLAATLVGKGRRYDLALLKVEPITPLTAAKFGESDAMQIGDPVIAIGNPFGLGIAVSEGIISGLDRNLHYSQFDAFMQTDAALNHGNSGGPLFNLQGDVIGINTAIYSTEADGGSVGIGYAIPASDAKLMVPLLRQYGYLKFGSLELLPQAVSAELASALDVPQRGILIASLKPNSPALGKLKLGDIVLKIDNTDVDRPRDFNRRIGHLLGKSVTLAVYRGGHIVTVDVMPVQPLEEAGQPPAEMPHPVALDATEMPLGAEVAPLTPVNRMRFSLGADQSGVVVTKVRPGSPSAAAGLSVGDVIETVQMVPVSTAEEASREIEQARSLGRRFVVGLVKGTKDTRFVIVPLPPRP